MKKFIYPILVFCGILLFIFSPLFGYSVFMIMDRSNQEIIMGDHQLGKTTYKYLMIDTSSGEVDLSEGFATIPDRKEGISGVSTNEGEGIQVLISEVGTQEYHITGSCVCEVFENIEERRSSMVVSRGVSFFVAAFTSVVAYQKAKEYLDKECHRVFEDEEQRHCDEVKGELEKQDEELEEWLGEKAQEKYDVASDAEKAYFDEKFNKGEKGDYHCRGNCITNMNLKQPELMEKAKNRKCEDMIIESNINIFEDCYFDIEEPRLRTLSKDEELEYAGKYFWKFELEYQCEILSGSVYRSTDSSTSKETAQSFYSCNRGKDKSKVDFEKCNVICFKGRNPSLDKKKDAVVL